MKKGIKFKYILEVEHSDLDLVLQDDIFGANPNGHDIDEHISDDSNLDKYAPAYINEAINIDVVINTLMELKEVGSTHVEIVHHDDHHAYHFIGVEVTQASQDEIKLHQKLREEANDKDKKIKELQNQIAELKGETINGFKPNDDLPF